MIARSHYDRDTLSRFLDDEVGDDAADMSSHIESCEGCRSTLESLVGEGLTMELAGDLLRGIEQPCEGSDFDRADPNVLTKSATRILEPSEHPNSLGRFARYEIMEVLGRGGMGIVMRGYDTSLNRHSAVKVLAPELASSAAARKRFSREARSAAAVVHPHVVPIQTVDEHNGLPYLVMPVVEGQSVEARVHDSGPLDVIEAVRIAAQVAEGLAAAHDQGLVHRDIKPANVLLENGVERVQITDFGLARAADDASMTRSGVIAGTPQYMSPEQAHGDAIDHRSDLFSLGSLIYFMLTGHSPFRAETTMGVLNRIVNDEPRSIRDINADVPEWLEQIVLKLLSKSPNDRFDSAAEVAELLQGCLAHAQNASTALPPPVAKLVKSSGVRPECGNANAKPPVIKWLAAAGFGFMLLLAGVLIVLEMNKGTLTIECEADDIPIRIMQGDKLVEELTVKKGAQSVRISAGNYVVEIDGEFDRVRVENGAVSLSRGATEAVKITQTTSLDDSHATANRDSAQVVHGRFMAVVEEVTNENTYTGGDEDYAGGDADDDALQLRAFVRESMAKYIRIGDPAKVKIDALPTAICDGQVTAVEHITDPPLRNGMPGLPYVAIIAFDTKPKLLKAGMTGKVDIESSATAVNSSVPKIADQSWGQSKNGLRLGVASYSPNTPRNEPLTVKLFVENKSQEHITLTQTALAPEFDVRRSSKDQVQTILGGQWVESGMVDHRPVRLPPGKQTIIDELTIRITEDADTKAAPANTDLLIVDKNAFKFRNAIYVVECSQMVTIDGEELELKSGSIAIAFSRPASAAERDQQKAGSNKASPAGDNPQQGSPEPEGNRGDAHLQAGGGETPDTNAGAAGNERTPAPLTEQKTLLQAVSEFNNLHPTDGKGRPQPPLTSSEVVACLKWKLGNGDFSEDIASEIVPIIYTSKRMIPAGWQLTGGLVRSRCAQGIVQTWEANLEIDGPSKYIPIRRTPLAPPAAVRKPSKAPDDERSTRPLADAIDDFNAGHHEIERSGMLPIEPPPLTVDEVLAAIVLWETRREEAWVDDATFERFQRIAQTHQIPTDARLEVVPSVKNAIGQSFYRWSIRMRLPHATKRGLSHVFTIREQFMGANRKNKDATFWGKPGSNGVQAGFRLVPSRETFEAGQILDVEFLFRSVTGKKVSAKLPGTFRYRRLRAQWRRFDLQGKNIGDDVRITIGDEPTVVKTKRIQFVTTADQEVEMGVGTKMVVDPKKSSRLQFVVSNPGNGASDEELVTGWSHYFNQPTVNPEDLDPLFTGHWYRFWGRSVPGHRSPTESTPDPDYIDPFQIGVSLGPADKSRIPAYYAGGLKVTKVAPQSPAQAVGIEVGDILLSWEGHQIYDSDPNKPFRNYNQPNYALRAATEENEKSRGWATFNMKFDLLDHGTGEVVKIAPWFGRGAGGGPNKAELIKHLRERKRVRATQ